MRLELSAKFQDAIKVDSFLSEEMKTNKEGLLVRIFIELLDLMPSY